MTNFFINRKEPKTIDEDVRNAMDEVCQKRGSEQSCLFYFFIEAFYKKLILLFYCFAVKYHLIFKYNFICLEVH